MKTTPKKSKEKEPIYIISKEDFKKYESEEMKETFYCMGVFFAVMLIFFHHQIFYFISQFISFLAK